MDKLEAIQIASRTFMGILSAPFGPWMYPNAFYIPAKQLQDNYPWIFRILYIAIFLIMAPHACIQANVTYTNITKMLATENQTLRNIYQRKTEYTSSKAVNKLKQRTLTPSLSNLSRAMLTIAQTDPENCVTPEKIKASAKVTPLIIEDYSP